MNTLNQLQPKTRFPLTAFSIFASLLLLAVFTVGCSEQRLSALSSDDQATSTEATNLTENEQMDSGDSFMLASGGTIEGTFRVTFFGDITGGPAEKIHSRIKPSSRQVSIGQPPMPLNLAYFQTALAGGGNCFSSGEFSTIVMIFAWKKNNPSLATAQLYFNAIGSDGVTEIRYELVLQGTFADSTNWPPVVGTQNTVILTDWDMKTNGKGQNRNISCTGEGTFSSGVTILIERIS